MELKAISALALPGGADAADKLTNSQEPWKAVSMSVIDCEITETCVFHI